MAKGYRRKPFPNLPTIIQPSHQARELRERRRGTPEQREAEMRAYFAEKAAEKVPEWKAPRELRNIPLAPLQRNRPEIIAAYRAMPYQEYLKTAWWNKIRKAAIWRAGGKCEDCKESKPLEVHHKTYDRLGTEADEDLIALCRFCHQLRHSQQSINN